MQYLDQSFLFFHSSEDRVRSGLKKLTKARQGSTQGRLDSFFSVIPSPSAGSKRKVNIVCLYVVCVRTERGIGITELFESRGRGWRGVEATFGAYEKMFYIQNWGPVHICTSAFSFETAYISMRFGVLSTLRRWAFSAKPHQCDNALKSGSRWKRIPIVCVKTVWKR